MSPSSRSNLLVIFLVAAVLGAGVVFRGGAAIGRMFAMAEIAGFALGMFWRVVLVVVVLFWLRSVFRSKDD